MFSKIIATGSSVPKHIVTNDELAARMDTSDEWIRTRTGIRERHIADRWETEKLLKLAVKASEKALSLAEERGLMHDEIDLVIVASSTPDYLFPACSCLLSSALELKNPAAFDLSLACTGFIAALSAAEAYLSAGIYKNALIVGADVMSKLIDFTDRSTDILFGDGAGAVVLSADKRFKLDFESGMLGLKLGSDGSRGPVLTCDNLPLGKMSMNGRAVFEFAVREVPKLIKDLLSEHEKQEVGCDKGEGQDSLEDIKYFILHQANYRIIEAVAKRLKAPIDRFPTNIERYANTTAATIPMLLDEMNREGRLKDGDKIVLAGFGAGLSLGAMLLRW